MYVSNDYLDQNISPYYADRVKAVTARLKEKQGPYFFQTSVTSAVSILILMMIVLKNSLNDCCMFASARY